MSTHCTLHLLALKPRVSLGDFGVLLRQSNLKPFIEGRVSGWAVKPTHLSTEDLVTQSTWDIALLLQNEDQLSSAIRDAVSRSWRLDAHFPSTMLTDLSEANHDLLFPKPGTVPSLTSEWSQGTRPPASSITVPKTDPSIGEVPITPERAAWMRAHGERPEGGDAVTMLNLLAYVPESGKAKMAGYAAAFQPAFGVKYGTALKVFGSVDSYDSRDGDLRTEGYAWDDCIMVHYPSIWHFGEMLASDGYAALEHEHKVGAMRDTCILCISETGLLRAQSSE